MTSVEYHRIVKNHSKPEEIRLALVRRYYDLGGNASKTARVFGTKRQTVAKWVARYERDGIAGLRNASRAPKTVPRHKTPHEIEERIVAIVKAKKYRIGQDRVRLELPEGMKVSTSAINRIMHAHNLITKRKRKYQRKRQCAGYLKTLRALRHWQVDVKELRDIPNVVALVRAGVIPNYQYTARDRVTGLMFVAYAWEHSMLNSTRFVSAVFEHLRLFGVHPGEVVVQTDNGGEFIGSINAKEDSLFSRTVEHVYHAKHKTIPLGKKEWQGVVESAHGRIEYEFYDVERFDSLEMFLSKAYTYILYWNVQRKRLSDKKCPLDGVKEKCHIRDPAVGDFKPIVLDSLQTFSQHYRFQGVPYVGDEVSRLFENSRKVKLAFCLFSAQ